jgi:hypothetical protein
LLDSGETHNARAIKKDENYAYLLAFDSEVKSKLFIKQKKHNSLS